MLFRILAASLLCVGMATAAFADSGDSRSDAGGIGDSPGTGRYTYKNSVWNSDDDTTEKDPNACWTLPRTPDGKGIVAPSEAPPTVPRKCP